jgi:hypothetical protein
MNGRTNNPQATSLPYDHSPLAMAKCFAIASDLVSRADVDLAFWARQREVHVAEFKRYHQLCPILQLRVAWWLARPKYENLKFEHYSGDSQW